MIKELNDSYIGKLFKFKIQGIECIGKIQKQDEVYYFCQDSENGARCNDKLGYKYSWLVFSGSIDDLESTYVSDIFLHNDKLIYSIY